MKVALHSLKLYYCRLRLNYQINISDIFLFLHKTKKKKKKKKKKYILCLFFFCFFFFCFFSKAKQVVHAYSRILMAQTSSGPKKVVWDMGNSSHWGLIVVQGQKTNSEYFGFLFQFSTHEAIQMSAQNIQFHDEIRKFPYIFVFLSFRKNFVGTPKRVRISHSKQAIGIWSSEVQPYLSKIVDLFIKSCLFCCCFLFFMILENTSMKVSHSDRVWTLLWEKCKTCL